MQKKNFKSDHVTSFMYEYAVLPGKVSASTINKDYSVKVSCKLSDNQHGLSSSLSLSQSLSLLMCYVVFLLITLVYSVVICIIVA